MKIMKHIFTIEEALRMKRLVEPFHPSPDGERLAYGVQHAFHRPSDAVPRLPTGALQEFANSEIWVTTVHTGETHILTPGWGTSWAPRWSPDGRLLAFYSDRDGVLQLWIWERNTNQAHPISNALVWPSLWSDVPQWTPDGSRIVCKLRPEEDKASLTEKATESIAAVSSDRPVQVWESPSPSPNAPQDSGWASVISSDSWFGAEIGIIDVETGEINRLTGPFHPSRMEVSPDGKALAIMSCSDFDALTWALQFDLYSIQLDGGSYSCLSRRIPQDMGQVLSWSPDSSSIAYLREEDTISLWSVSVSDKSLQNLTEGLKKKWQSFQDGPLWSLDSKFLFCVANGDVWRLSMKGAPPYNLTEGFDGDIISIVSRSEGSLVYSFPEETVLLVQVTNPMTHSEGFYRLDLSTQEMKCKKELEKHYRGRGQVSRNAQTGEDMVFYISESEAHPADIWIADTSLQMNRQVTKINSQVREMRMGKSRLIEWENHIGEVLKGALLLPADDEAMRPYPLILYIWGGGALRRVHCFGLVGEDVDNLQILASRGYAVLMPDVPLKAGNLPQQMAAAVLPAVDKLVHMGIANPDRLGVMGFGVDGYFVNSLITQTSRFRAAVSEGGFSNLISLYGQMNENGISGGIAWCENPKRLAGTLWDVRELYIESSPIFHLDKVETPLLLLHGSEDGSAPITHAKEMFSGLRRLGKRAMLFCYPGEGHYIGAWSMDHIVDMWNRILDWFDQYLA